MLREQIYDEASAKFELKIGPLLMGSPRGDLDKYGWNDAIKEMLFFYFIFSKKKILDVIYISYR